MLGPIIEDQFNAAFNWPLGAALSFIMLAIVLLILLAASPVPQDAAGEARMTRLAVKIYLGGGAGLSLSADRRDDRRWRFNRSALYELPFTFDLVWFKALAGNDRLLQASWNSVWIAAVNAVIATALGTLAAYAFARYEFRGQATAAACCCFRRSPFPG